MTTHRPPPSRAVVEQRMAEMITVAQAEQLGAHISVLDLYRGEDGVLRIRDGGAVEDWLDGRARGLDSRRW